MKKILLLSDIPPCSNYTGGVVLADQIRELPEQSVVAFVVLNPALQPEYVPDLHWLKIKTVEKPNEFWPAEIRGTAEAREGETRNREMAVPDLIRQAAAFGREQGVEAIWAMLEGQTVVRMAGALADELQLPLYTQVWDPLSWWLDAHGVDPENSAEAQQKFDYALNRSSGVATASWAMAEHYERRYSVYARPVINSQPAQVSRTPEPTMRSHDRLTIGIVGQFYADDAWAALVQGLADADWKVGWREVSFFYLGHEPPQNLPAERLVHGGWMDQPAAIAALSAECDVCYCPYPFRRSMEEVARFSFPSKLVMFAAAGKPIFCHAPWYASPARYVADRRCGVVCGDANGAAAVALMRWLTTHDDVYRFTALNSQRAFAADFQRDAMMSNFRQVIESEPR